LRCGIMSGIEAQPGVQAASLTVLDRPAPPQDNESELGVGRPRGR
jgi:hypothetical protein